MEAVHRCATVVILPSGNVSSPLSRALERKAEDGYFAARTFSTDNYFWEKMPCSDLNADMGL